MATIGDALANDGLTTALIGTEQGATPASPAAGARLLYPKADGWYGLDSAGTETGPFSAGGGSGGGVSTAFVNPSDGSVAINTSSAWANLSTYAASFTDITLSGVSAGDVLMVSFAALWSNEAVTSFLDAATIVSGSIVNYISSRASTPTTNGPRIWQGVSGAWNPVSGYLLYTVQAGDIHTTDQVTLRPRVMCTGAKTFYYQGGQFAAVNLS